MRGCYHLIRCLCIMAVLWAMAYLQGFPGAASAGDRESLVLGHITPTEELINKFGYGVYAPEEPHPSPETMRYPVILPGLPTRNLPVNEGRWNICGQCHRLDAPLGRPDQAPPDIFEQLEAPAFTAPTPGMDAGTFG